MTTFSDEKYKQAELATEYKYLAGRQKLGAWREDDIPDINECIERIDWILCGNYGAGTMFYAEQIIENNLQGKTGKNVDKAWLAIGRELIMLVALHDTTEFTARKLTEVWKAQGVNFTQANEAAAIEIKRILSEKEAAQ